MRLDILSRSFLRSLLFIYFAVVIDVVLVSSFHVLFCCFHCWFWIWKCPLPSMQYCSSVFVADFDKVFVIFFSQQQTQQNNDHGCFSSVFNTDLKQVIPNSPSISLFKVNKISSKTMGAICSKLTTRTPERRQWRLARVLIVTF